MKAIVPTVVAALLFVMTPAPAAGADAWAGVRSANFRVVGDVSAAHLRSIARTLEQFRRATTRLFPNRVVANTRPLTVVVVPGNIMLDFTNDRLVAGFYSSRPDHDYIVINGDMIAAGLPIALHEFQHLITHATWKGLPRWVDEGVAEFYSTFTEADGGKRYQIGRIIEGRLNWLKMHGTMDLMQFLADDGRSTGDNDDKILRFYAQSWGLVHFFALGENGKWAGRFPLFVEALASRMPPEEAFRKTVTEDVEGFKRAFTSYTNGIGFPYVWMNVSAAEEPAFVQENLTVAETETIKATLIVNERKATQALAAAVAADPAYYPARAVRARRLLFARDAGALSSLREVVAANPQDFSSCGLAMLALNMADQSTEAAALCPGGDRDVSVAFERTVALDALGRSAEAGVLRARLLAASSDDVSRVGSWRYWRYLEAGLYSPARRAAELMAAHEIGGADTIGYSRFVRAVSQCLAGYCDLGRDQLRSAGMPVAGAWVQSVYRYLTAAIGEAEFLKLAKNREHETEAHAYIGLMLLGQKNVAGAMPHLKWVADRGSDKVTEYYVAVAHYRRLTASASAARN